MRQGRADHPGRAVMQRRHGVIEMGEPARASLQCRDSLIIICGAVTDLNSDAARGQIPDQRVAGIAFRRQGDQLDRNVGAQFRDERQIGCLRKRRLRAQAVRIEVGALQMGS